MAWKTRIFVLLSFNYKLLCINTIDASLQLDFGFIEVTSIRSLERTVRLCVVSILIKDTCIKLKVVSLIVLEKKGAVLSGS